jgi:S-adenosylmethionine:tRNA ribosyltransferase-isomerase
MLNTKQYNSFDSQVAYLKSIEFNLPSSLEASEPPEERGLSRDEVRLMVSYRNNNNIIHSKFTNLADFIEPGDLLVINTSGTMSSAIDATRKDGTKLKLHLSTHLPSDLWIVEVRRIEGNSTKPFNSIRPCETLSLPGGANVTLHAHYRYVGSETVQESERLWIATLNIPIPLQEYLREYGIPIRYGYVKENWPISYYQTVYATEPGSAEMPSAGRAFTSELLTKLVSKGVQIAPLLLHTGVSSLEGNELPYEEYFRIPEETAQIINETRKTGKRVIAVGTTVVRALETVTDKSGVTHPGQGWTNIIISPERGIRSVNAMLTGLHEPKATHLAMLEALAGIEHLSITYQEAIKEKYLWHEFGDLHLLLP